MPFGVLSGVGRGMGVLDGVEIVEGEGEFCDKCGTSHYNQWGLCGVVILYHEGWRRGSSQIALGFVVVVVEHLWMLYAASLLYGVCTRVAY